MQERETLFARRAGQAIARKAPEVGLQVRIATGDFSNEGTPQRAITPRLGCGHLGQQERRVVSQDLARFEIEDASRCVQEHRMRVPVGGPCSHAGVAGRWPLAAMRRLVMIVGPLATRRASAGRTHCAAERRQIMRASSRAEPVSSRDQT